MGLSTFFKVLLRLQSTVSQNFTSKPPQETTNSVSLLLLELEILIMLQILVACALGINLITSSLVHFQTLKSPLPSPVIIFSEEITEIALI